MGLPQKDNIHLPILKVLSEAGGSLSMHEAKDRVKKFYPDLTPDDINSRLDSGGNRLNNRIGWARQDLVLTGDVDRTTTGIWVITQKGRQRLEQEWPSWKPEYYKTPSPKPQITIQAVVQTQVTGDPIEQLEQARRELISHVQTEILERLHTVDPSEFENMIAEMLEKLEYGSRNDGSIKVTGRSGDGGIDGECAMDRLGIYKALFQAKRWSKTVSPEDVRGFVGALHNKRVDHGIFVTTSDFSQQARDEAKQAGNVKLIDGKELARIMVEAGMGVRRIPLDVPRIDEDYFSGLA